MKRPLWILVILFGSLLGLASTFGALRGSIETAVAAPQADFPLHVDYASDVLSLEYAAGNTVFITVTDPAGIFKATAVVQTVANGAGPGIDGYQIFGYEWFPIQPDIEAFDTVEAGVPATGDFSVLQIGDIVGALDHLIDRITVSIAAPWLLPGPLPTDCHPWTAPGGAPGFNFPLVPDGVTTHTCIWDPISEWDIVPGDEVAIEYRQPNNSSVLNVFRNPAPSIFIFQDNLSAVGENGNYQFAIGYGNYGDGPAQNVVIQSDLTAGFQFITHTAPFTYSEISPGLHQWELGTLPPDTEGHFELFVQVTAPFGQPVQHDVQISTSNPYNTSSPGQMQSVWSDFVTVGFSLLSVYKDARTPDPYPGSNFVYWLDVCNDGFTTSDWVTLTDTLPSETTLVDWWADKPGWVGSSSGGDLILSKPTIPANYCERVNVEVMLDVGTTPGQMITNTAVLTSSSDIDPSGNFALYAHPVGVLHPNLYTYAWWERGQLVPGGLLYYHVGYGNSGNDRINNVYVTNTLPIGTQFVASEVDLLNGKRVPITPTVNMSGTVVWDIGNLDAGEYGELVVTLQIDWSTSPGTSLVNTLDITQVPNEDSFTDNRVTIMDVVRPPGPNLRIFKNGFGSGGYVNYQLTIQNIGSRPIGQFAITDTYPISLFLTGYFDTDFSRLITWTDNVSASYLTAVYSNINSGEVIWANFDATVLPPSRLSGAPPQPVITNTAFVEQLPGETDLNDNVAQHVMPFGVADVWVKKVASSCCGLVPGAPLNYIITYGNKGTADAFDVYLSDVLPPDVTFDSAMPPPSSVFGSTVDWYDPVVPAGTQHTIVLTVTLSPQLPPGVTLVNYVDIFNSSGDIDPSNNAFTHFFSGTANLVLQKDVSDGIVQVNTPFTYSLDVINNGPDPATNVLVTDQLPPGLSLLSSSSETNLFNCQRIGQAVECQAPVMDPAITDTIELVVSAGQTGGTVNFARIESDQIDLQPINNVDSVATLVINTTGPGLLSITPNSGANTGVTPVTVSGYNFEAGSQLSLSRGGQRFPLSNVQFVNATTLRGSVPASLTPGSYNLRIQNSSGAQAILLNAFTVYSGSPPVVTAVLPRQGPDNRPIRVDIRGSNFANPVLAALSDGTTLIPLVGIDTINGGHVQATVPISLTPGTYDVVIQNPNQVSGTLPAAYTVIDASLQDDLFGFEYEFGNRPASPQVGQATELGFLVYRQGGQQAFSNVDVAFYDGPPARGGSSLIGQVVIPTLAPNTRVPVTTTWTPTATGLHTLYVVIDPNDGVPESDEQNNSYRHDVFVRRVSADNQPPQVTNFEINNGAASTNQRQVVLDTTAVDNVGVAYLLYIEYIFSQNADSWLPVQSSGWLTYAGAATAYDWQLAPRPGVHYMQAWAADAAGNVSQLPGQAFINSWPDSGIPLGHSEGHMYRYPLTAGSSVQARVTTLSGDADLYVWDENGNLIDSSQLDDPVDEVIFTAPTDGIYQIEVTGADGAVYQLEIVPTSRGPATPPGRGHVKGRGAPYGGPGNSPPNNPSLPTLPAGSSLIFLPAVLHAP